MWLFLGYISSVIASLLMIRQCLKLDRANLLYNNLTIILFLVSLALIPIFNIIFHLINLCDDLIRQRKENGKYFDSWLFIQKIFFIKEKK